ncbi:hypothetical protein [Subtercola frigoramans]|uniref:Uncharacterized protein n=1 Tax=Subtercola frigoramans TaxID=120298 RepID=A0ABS2L750_9MICO|nr:hypothetical protein [Subtercola frigoramans]MBM7472928.1 hypothetical protein [Subtercola frigoramans]
MITFHSGWWPCFQLAVLALFSVGVNTFSVFVNQRPFEGDPATIVLTNKLDIDLVLAPRGTTPAPSAPFAWPAEY